MEIKNRTIGNDRPFFLIAGPCVIESEAMAMKTAEALTRLTGDLNIPFVYKSSYDKANRTSIRSFRGLGKEEGLKVMEQVKREFGIPITSDVHNLEEIGPAAEVLDILQIPAFLCRQTDLILAAADTGKMVNIKKGQFLAPWDMKSVLDKATSSGNQSILLTERGTSFGYNNLVTDFRSLVIMREWGHPVVFDATHSVQLPGGQGDSSGGQREFVPHLMRAAVSVGIAGIFIEVHPDPDNAPSDGPNMLKLDTVKPMLEEMIRIEEVVKPIEQRTSV